MVRRRHTINTQTPSHGSWLRIAVMRFSGFGTKISSQLAENTTAAPHWNLQALQDENRGQWLSPWIFGNARNIALFHCLTDDHSDTQVTGDPTYQVLIYAQTGEVGPRTQMSDYPCRVRRLTQHPVTSASDCTFLKRLIFWAGLN
jgi:hypothetical protein